MEDDKDAPAAPKPELELPLSSRELLQTMVDACYYVGTGCPICRDLVRKIEGLNDQQPVDSSVLLEMENSRLVRQQFAMCAQTFAVSSRARSTASSADPVDYTEGNVGVMRSYERAGRIDASSRESRRSDLHDQVGKNLTISYGLHNLIKEVEARGHKDYKQVFKNMDTDTRRSLLAQITCDEILWMQTEGDPRLLKLIRIEQELTDLMNKEEASRSMLPDRHSSFGGTSTSKKSSQDQGY